MACLGKLRYCEVRLGMDFVARRVTAGAWYGVSWQGYHGSLRHGMSRQVKVRVSGMGMAMSGRSRFGKGIKIRRGWFRLSVVGYG